ncbi:ribosome biogenesis GTPase Der, putative [Acanthamoeba castellanii str. Neff]|uniref:GTPase Der n=1 Tax=Acanthamoeba castellanii (strain ATCC 30010 / Neff) TaxID=1257118 RepID=L8HDL2_ACACF|nr:ribosome biogenesis GTPase Der, putative [Acanthamoeba castellanii str. Neff]ELR22486.1 ribosome biogenesis GTPase Der, putative [Acanthamoeba castellanii str. Neff]
MSCPIASARGLATSRGAGGSRGGGGSGRDRAQQTTRPHSQKSSSSSSSSATRGAGGKGGGGKSNAARGPGAAAATKKRAPSGEASKARPAAEEEALGGVESDTERYTMRRDPVLALVGLPNCGKSTLFNRPMVTMGRLVRMNKSLVTSEPGTTRDRVYAYCDIGGRSVMVVDTGGMVGTGDFFSPLIHEQALVAINEADIILFLFDFREGVTKKDVEVARVLRKHVHDKDIVLVANKCDNPDLVLELDERNKAGPTGKPDDYWLLGLGPAIPVSAIHGAGAGELLDKVYDIVQTKFPAEDQSEGTHQITTSSDWLATAGLVSDAEAEAELARKRISISIVGRPNVGKSSFLNQVLGRERVIVTNVAGTTHDAVDHSIMWRGKKPRKRKRRAAKATMGLEEEAAAATTEGKQQDAEVVHAAEDDEVDEQEDDLEDDEQEDDLDDDEHETKVRAKKANNTKLKEPAANPDADGVPIRIVDTAGINRRATHVKGLERSSVLWAIKSINRSDIVLQLIDATQGITDQDLRIAEHILNSKATTIVVVNKWDMSKESKQKWEKYVQETLKFMKYVPIMFCSAKTGVNVKETIDLAIRITRERAHFIKTSTLMKLLESAHTRHRPPSKNGRQLKIRYATQAKVKVPSFTFFVNDVELVHFTYQRFLENAIREFHPYTGSPMRLIFKDKEKTIVS